MCIYIQIYVSIQCHWRCYLHGAYFSHKPSITLIHPCVMGFLLLSPFPGTLLKALESPVLFYAVEEHFGPDSHIQYNRFCSTLALERNHEINIDRSFILYKEGFGLGNVTVILQALSLCSSCGSPSGYAEPVKNALKRYSEIFWKVSGGNQLMDCV